VGRGQAQEKDKMKLVSCQLTQAEVNHLLGLIDSNEREGTYTDPQYQYWSRSDRIKAKLTPRKNKKRQP